MQVIEKFVLLLKAQKTDGDKDKYEELLQNNGYTVKHIKTLEFIYHQLESLKSKLENPSSYSGIIFSSPRCVTAVKQALRGSQLAEEWLTKTNFVVGETSYDDALKELNLTCLGKETGNANNLTELIKGSGDYPKPFLVPHGDYKTDTFRNNFAGTHVTIDEVLSYRTVANPNIGAEFFKVTKGFEIYPEYIVFFSPSGVRTVSTFLDDTLYKSVKMIAIGPTTQKAMQDLELKIYNVSEQPRPEDLLRILV